MNKPRPIPWKVRPFPKPYPLPPLVPKPHKIGPGPGIPGDPWKTPPGGDPIPI